MKPRITPSNLALIAITFSAIPAHAQNTWDGGGGANTNVNTAANWNNDTVNPLNGSTTAAFASGSATTATINVDALFSAVTLNRTAGGFTIAAGDGNLRIKNSTSGGTKNLIVSSSLGGNAVINAPLIADATLGGGLLVIQNNKAVTLDLNGPLSGTAAFALRYEGVASSITRVDGTITSLTAVGSASNSWAGDLVIGGDQSLAATDISISSGAGFGTPTTAARFVLGESSSDDQTWNNITLNNVMNLAIGGNITANAFSGNTVNTRISGASTTGNISFNSGTIGANVILGGAGTNQNDPSIIKKSSGILNINSTNATYTGATTVEAGTLNISSATSLASPITVKAGATLGGEGATTSSLTFDSGASTLAFDPTTPGSLTTSGFLGTGATVIASPTSATAVDTPYKVLTRSSGTFSAGEVAAFLPAGRATVGGAGTSTITYTATAPTSLTWKGNHGTNPTFWDLGTTFNWENLGPERFFANDSVTFDDTASTFNVAAQGSSVSPGNLIFTNTTAQPYALSGGGISGTGSLTKNNTGTVTIANALSHTGGITLNSGVLALTSSSNTFIGGINITGGDLQFTGSSLAGALNAQPVTLTGGTVTRVTTNTTITNDSQTFAMNANGVAIKVDSNTNTTWRIGGKISGSGNWTKSGPGVLSLGRGGDTSSANDFTGTLTVTGGTLDIRHGDSLGTTEGATSVQDSILLMQNFGQTAGTTITVNEPLNFSGNAFLTGYCQENKSFTQRFNGAITLAASAVVGVSTARNSSGAITPLLELNNSTIVTTTGSVLSFGLRPGVTPAGTSAGIQTVNVGSAISGPGSVTAQGDAGSAYSLSAPGYSGNTTVNSSTLRLNAPNPNNQSSTISIAATGATLQLNFNESGGPVTDNVEKLFIGGVQQNAGVYKATDNVTDSGIATSQITGPGTLTVTTGPSGFISWATANGIPGALPTADPDFDGLSNLLEYAIGTNPTASTTAPGTWSGNTITFQKGATAITNADVNYIIETSTDLGIQDPWEAEVTQTAPNQSASISHSFTPGSPARKFARLRTILTP